MTMDQNPSSTQNQNDLGDARVSLESKVEDLIKELKNIQARVPTMSVPQRERYVSLSKRLVALQEKVRSPGS